MQLDNPAVYECKGDRKQGLHYWRRLEDGRAQCQNCKLVISEKHAEEVFSDGS